MPLWLKKSNAIFYNVKKFINDLDLIEDDLSDYFKTQARITSVIQIIKTLGEPIGTLVFLCRAPGG